MMFVLISNDQPVPALAKRVTVWLYDTAEKLVTYSHSQGQVLDRHDTPKRTLRFALDIT
jgi:hypothetical protein